MLSVAIHGHFYQPPRENPVTGIVEAEPNAAPDHDWNARIDRECYAPLAAVPVGRAGANRPHVNAYEWMSFNFGSTLLEWMQQAAPQTYTAMLAGDAASVQRLGHGNAIAMPYHHIIMPLASRRDQCTEVRWGVADFRRRFGRDPEGMWLPETAVDEETLDVLASEHIAFTVLAPHQVTPAPVDGLPERVPTSRGRSIAVFVYDGAASHDVAFGKMLDDSEAWERALLARTDRQLVSLAMDGETFGHHHKFADLALGALLHRLSRKKGVRLDNFGSALARHAPRTEAKLVSPSSWSCPHGVERWRSDCGCRFSQEGSSQQRWRAPLRKAMDWLAHEVCLLYERGTSEQGLDPWRTRDTATVWDRVMHRDPRLNRLLDMDRNAQRALTSCAWFFDDFGGLEGRQVLRYASRAIALSGGEAPRLEAGFLERLEGCLSNDPKVGSARDWYRTTIRPERVA